MTMTTSDRPMWARTGIDARRAAIAAEIRDAVSVASDRDRQAIRKGMSR